MTIGSKNVAFVDGDNASDVTNVFTVSGLESNEALASLSDLGKEGDIINYDSYDPYVRIMSPQHCKRSLIMRFTCSCKECHYRQHDYSRPSSKIFCPTGPTPHVFKEKFL